MRLKLLAVLCPYLAGQKLWENNLLERDHSNYLSLSDNSGLRLTTAMYFLPDGSTIHEEGVEAKYLVECSEENETKLRIQKYSEGVMSKESFKEQFGFLPIVDEHLKAEEVILNSDHEIKHNLEVILRP